MCRTERSWDLMALVLVEVDESTERPGHCPQGRRSLGSRWATRDRVGQPCRPLYLCVECRPSNALTRLKASGRLGMRICVRPDQTCSRESMGTGHGSFYAPDRSCELRAGFRGT